MIGYLIDILKYFGRFIGIFEEVMIFDGKMRCPVFLLILLPHELDLLEMTFGVVAVFVECPVIVGYIITKHIDA